MPTLELLKTIGAYPTIIYLSGLFATLILAIVFVYQISSCFVAWLHKKNQ